MSNFKSIGQGVRGLRLPKIGGFPLTLNVALTTVLRTNVLHCDISHEKFTVHALLGCGSVKPRIFDEVNVCMQHYNKRLIAMGVLCWLARLLSFKRPLLSVDVSVGLFGCRQL